MKKFAYVTATGEVAHIIEPSDENALTDGQIVNQYLVVEVPFEEDATELLTVKVYNKESKSWANRAPKPSSVHYWDNGWKLDSEALHKEIRTKRNYLLSKTDWTQIPDASVSIEEKEQWKKYRQALRDLPELYINATSLDEVVWPEQPK